MPITSKISSGTETALPPVVRDHLHVQPGDDVEYELREGCVILRPARVKPASEDPFVHFTEWSGDADEAAYRDL